MTNNAEILIAAVQAFVDPAKTEAFRDRIRLCQDWDALISQADAHRVSPIVWKVLSTVVEGSAPKEVFTQIRSNIERNALKNIKVIGELRRIVDLFERNNIRSVPFKGPVLAISAYGDIGLRRFDDLDILVPRDSVLKARDCLAAEGFQLLKELHWNCDSAGLKHVHGEFSMTRGPISIDLHWRLIPDFLPYGVDSQDIWTDLATVKIAGREMLTLSPEHQLLFLAAHGTKHQWYRLGWVCDFAQFLLSVTIDWQKLDRLAEFRATRIMLLHSLSVARDFAGLDLPSGAQALMAQSPEVEMMAQKLAPGILRRLDKEDAPKVDFLESYQYARSFDRSGKVAARLLNGMALAPRETEWKALHLPPFAYPLYYPFRMARFAVKSVLGRHD